MYGLKCKKLMPTPKEYAAFLYRSNFKRTLNRDNPVELNEKIRWIQFNTDITLWTLLADKYLARSFVEDKGYSDILVKLYGVWDKSSELISILYPIVLSSKQIMGVVKLSLSRIKALQTLRIFDQRWMCI